MPTWDEFAQAEPEMAARGARQMQIPIAYLATVRRAPARASRLAHPGRWAIVRAD